LYGQDYYNRLKNLSVSTSLNNLLPKDFTGRDDTMILNAVFLVSKSNVPDFTNTVDQLKKGNKSSGMFIEATGPWPPFSFISLKEKQR
jgi:flavoprotein